MPGGRAVTWAAPNARRGLGRMVERRHGAVCGGFAFAGVRLLKRRGNCNAAGRGERNKVDLWDEERGHFLRAAEYLDAAGNYFLVVLDAR